MKCFLCLTGHEVQSRILPLGGIICGMAAIESALFWMALSQAYLLKPFEAVYDEARLVIVFVLAVICAAGMTVFQMLGN